MTPPLPNLEGWIRAVVRDEITRTTATADVGHFTVKEYAAQYRISPSTVREAIRDGRLPVVRIGRAVRIEAAARIDTAPRVDAATNRARNRLLRR